MINIRELALENNGNEPAGDTDYLRIEASYPARVRIQTPHGEVYVDVGQSGVDAFVIRAGCVRRDFALIKP